MKKLLKILFVILCFTSNHVTITTEAPGEHPTESSAAAPVAPSPPSTHVTELKAPVDSSANSNVEETSNEGISSSLVSPEGSDSSTDATTSSTTLSTTTPISTTTPKSKVDKNKWSAFLNSLYNKLTEYEIQTNVEKYDVSNLQSWGEGGTPSGIHINTENLMDFLNLLKNKYKIAEIEYILHFMSNNQIEEINLMELNQVLSYTLRKRISRSCMDSHMIIKGIFVSIKKLDSLKYLTFDMNCPETDERKTIVILALEKIFIDKDISHREKPLVIIARKWEIKDGNKIIDLSGRDNKQADRICDEKSFGESGSSGGPGNAGGVFFGIGDEFINGGALTINTNGGKGSDGQKGCPGMDGMNGDSAAIPEDIKYMAKRQFCGHLKSFRFECDSSSKCEPADCLGGVPTPNNSEGKYKCRECHYTISGVAGEKGEKGGDAGAGGKGGPAGFIELITLNGIKDINRSRRSIDGKDGKAGEGGKGGKKGNKLILHCRTDGVVFEKKSEAVEKYESRGEKGVTNSQTQAPPEVKRINNPTDYINEFKSFLRKNLLDNYHASESIEFLKRLEDNPKIEELYHFLGYFDELVRLEREFHKFNIGDGYIHFYYSLRKRVDKFYKSEKSKLQEDHLNNFEKSIDYLMSKIQQRIIDMIEFKNLKSMPVTKVMNYLSLIIKEIDDLDEDLKKQNEADIKRVQQENYNIKVASKIDEANTVVKNIRGEIIKIFGKSNSKVEDLIKNMTATLHIKKKQEQEFMSKKADLRNELALRAVLTAVNIVSFFLIPFGNIANLMLEKIKPVVESHVNDNEDFNDAQFFALPDAVINAITENVNITIFASLYENTFKQIKDTVGNESDILSLYEEMDQSIESVITVLARWENIKRRLKKKVSHGLNIEKLQASFGEYLQRSTVMNPTEASEIDNSKQSKKKLKVILRMIKYKFPPLKDLCDALSLQLDKYQENNVKLKKLEKNIKDHEDDIRDITEFFRETKKFILSNIDETKYFLLNKINHMKKESKVSLVDSKWAVQSQLDELLIKIEKKIEGIKRHDEFSYIKHIKEVFNELIDVYTQIQTFHEEKENANLQANLVSALGNNIGISAITVSKVIENLEILIKSNYIIEKYLRAESEFKKFLFPFADNYKQEERIVHFDSDEKLVHDKSLSLVQKRISDMIGYYEKYKSQQNAFAEGEFVSSKITKPFFTWKNNDNKRLISDLLSEKEVVFTADIEKSEIKEFDAVKFNRLSINFKIEDEKKESALNEALKTFKVRMIPEADFCYKFENKIYSFHQKSYTYWYSFDTVENEKKPRLSSQAYKNINEGDYVFSPYGRWKIKLINLQQSSEKVLKIFEKEKIDIELSGHAKYIFNDDSINPAQVEQRLEKIFVSSDLNFYKSTPTQTHLAEEIEKVYKKDTEVDHSIQEKNSDVDKPDKWSEWETTNFEKYEKH